MRELQILVAGGAGFIGSHLCEVLVNQGHHVVCVDSFVTGAHANVAHLLQRPNFELIRHDVTHPLFIKVDQIYNLACPASPGHYQTDPIHTMKTSVLGAIHMLGISRRTGARSLLASTSEVYGDAEQHPQHESYWGNVNPIGPRACYDEGKRAAETLYFDYERRHGLDTKVVRIFNTYGPRMHPKDGRVVSNFIVQALSGEPITVYGDGSQTRSFCYVDDLVRGLVAMMQSPAGFAGPVNLGNPQEFTVRGLAEMVIKMTNSRSQIVTRPLPHDDPRRRRPDIGTAQSQLAWSPTIDLTDGLSKTIEYFDRLLSRKDGESAASAAVDTVGV